MCQPTMDLTDHTTLTHLVVSALHDGIYSHWGVQVMTLEHRDRLQFWPMGQGRASRDVKQPSEKTVKVEGTHVVSISVHFRSKDT